MEQKLYASNRNEELLELMRIQKSLVYFVTALRSNEMLLLKIERTNFLGLTDDEKELLKDMIVDISQALEMANIYTNILSSTLDAFASIISNNFNNVMKRLTSITIVLMLPTLITSIYGMNVPLPQFPGGEHAQFWWLFGISVAIAAGMLAMFRRKRWI